MTEKGLSKVLAGLDPFLLRLNVSLNNIGDEGILSLGRWIDKTSKGYLTHLNISAN